MAGKTIICQILMRGTQVTQADHLMRVLEREDDQHQRGDGDDTEQPAVFQFQPQNNSMEIMCVSASTANARVIG